MPLRATIDGKPIISTLVDDEEWERLRKAVSSRKVSVVLPCCNGSAYLRTSVLGTPHFVHKVSTNCQWGYESPEHLKAKEEILLACRNAGYTASPEWSDADWRADVLAMKEAVKIAFEVQWTRQDLEKTLERQRKYEQNGIRACWFYQRSSPELFDSSPRGDLPLFYLDVDENSFIVKLNRRTYSLIGFVQALLSKKIKFCTKLRTKDVQLVPIIFLLKECWKCHKFSHVYYADIPISSCGIRLSQKTWEAQNYLYRPEIVGAVENFLKTDEGKHLRLKFHRNKMEKFPIKSFKCYWCGAPFNDYYAVRNAQVAKHNEHIVVSLETPICISEPLAEKWDHWCYPEDGKFCE